tara:strand:+ start:504 stop:740 length:237 start_codon:yes stop_codon:yes gene_type:complete
MTITQENEKLKKEVKELKKEIEDLKKGNKKKSSRKPSEYQQFVKKRFKDVKKENPEKKTPDIIKIIAEEWKKTKSDSP